VVYVEIHKTTEKENPLTSLTQGSNKRQGHSLHLSLHLGLETSDIRPKSA
jgi:hypothetical protein